MEIALLRETADAASGQLDLATVFRFVAQRARRLIQAETLLILVLDDGCAHYTYVSGCGKDGPSFSGNREGAVILYALAGRAAHLRRGCSLADTDAWRCRTS